MPTEQFNLKDERAALAELKALLKSEDVPQRVIDRLDMINDALFKAESRTLDYAIEQAARDLPDGYDISVCVENGAGWVAWNHTDADDITAIDAADFNLAEQTLRALETCKAEAVMKFHVNRQMFAIYRGKIYTAPIGDSRSHIEWFIDMGLMNSKEDPAFEEIVRGYAQDQGFLHAYRGKNYVSSEVFEMLAPFLDRLAKLLKLAPKTPIRLGVSCQGRPGESWPGQDIGLLCDVLKRIQEVDWDGTAPAPPSR